MAVVRALALLKTGGLISAGNVGAFYLKKLKSDGSSDNSHSKSNLCECDLIRVLVSN